MLTAHGLTKLCLPVARWGDKKAVDAIDLELRPGELVAVCGENGAGKTTLLKMMVGLTAPDAGHLELDGRRITFASPAAARARGVSMVEQHLALALELDAIENTALLAGPWLRLDRATIGKALAARAAELGLDVPLDVPMAQLDVGQRQKIELLRALGGSTELPRVLVLDEPTAVLLPHEAETLYTLVEGLVKRGTCVVVVTHRLGEVSRHADRVVVLSRGKKVHDAPFDRAGDPEVILAPIARVVFAGKKAPAGPRPQPGTHEGTPVATARELGAGRLRNATFSLRPGEIVGLAGVEGNGQRELLELLTARRTPETGTLSATTRAFVVADRHDEGLLLDASLVDNVLLGDHPKLGAILHHEQVEAEATRRLAPVLAQSSTSLQAHALSGGNQQKLLVARALARIEAEGAPFLCLAEPTRGVDAGAQADIHELLRAVARDRVPLVVQSSDLDELRALCTSLYVLERGQLVGPFPPDVADETLAHAMLGTAR